MRPSLTTLAGMTLAAAGTIAVAGIAIAGGTAGAETEMLQHEPAVTLYESPAQLTDVEAVFSQPPERQIIELGDGSSDLEDPGWFDGDDCPPCGMG